MSEKKSFIFYPSFLEALEGLADDAYIRLVKCVLTYGVCGEETELKGLEKNIFATIKAQIVANVRRRASGKSGGRSKNKKPKDDEEEKHRFKIEKPSVFNGETDGFQNENHSAKVVNHSFLNENHSLQDENHRLRNEKPNVNENLNENENVVVDRTTTKTLIFVSETAKKLGFFLTNNQAKGFCALDPAWLDGDYNFLAFAAEKIREGPEKKHGDQERVFAKAPSYVNLLGEYPSWKAEMEKKARDKARKDAVELARGSPPEKCENCGVGLITNGISYLCPACEHGYEFDEEKKEWVFVE